MNTPRDRSPLLVLLNQSPASLARAVKQRGPAMADLMALAVLEGDVRGAVALMDAGVGLSGTALFPGSRRRGGLYDLMMGCFSQEMADKLWPRFVARCPWLIGNISVTHNMIKSAELNEDPRPARAWLDPLLNALDPVIFFQSAVPAWTDITEMGRAPVRYEGDLVRRLWDALDRINDCSFLKHDSRILAFQAGMRGLDDNTEGQDQSLLDSKRMTLWLKTALTREGLESFTEQRWDRLQSMLDQKPKARGV